MSLLCQDLCLGLETIGKLKPNDLLSVSSRYLQIQHSDAWYSRLMRYMSFENRSSTVAELQNLIQRCMEYCQLLNRSIYLQINKGGGLLSAPEQMIRKQDLDDLINVSSSLKKFTVGVLELAEHYSRLKDFSIATLIENLIRKTNDNLVWIDKRITMVKEDNSLQESFNSSTSNLNKTYKEKEDCSSYNTNTNHTNDNGYEEEETE
jgi:hypothetical protein